MRIPKRQKTIQEHLKRYERELRKEKKTFGGFHDGGGLRYILVPYYTLLGDWRGAIKSYRWFEKNFPDDIGDSFHYLCSALAFYHVDDLSTAAQILRRAMFTNLYLLPRLLGLEPDKLDVRFSSNLEEPGFLDYAPPEFWAVWDEAALQWAKETYEGPALTHVREQYIEIERQLNSESAGPRRSELVSERRKLITGN